MGRRMLIGVCAVLWTARAFAADEGVYGKLEVLAKVLSYVETNYVESVKAEKLIDDAIKGMIAELDPHTMYLSPDLFREMKSDTRGEFFGIGVEITVKDDYLTVIAPIEDTPADQAGILPGDRIVKISGTSTKGMTLTDAVEKMRGPRGSKVHLTLEREGKPFDVSVVRDTVHVKSVSAQLLDSELGYIRLKSFQEKSSSELIRALDSLDRQAGGRVRGLIFDLRNNPGGLLDQAVKIADLFLESGVIVTTKGRQESFQEAEVAHKEGTRPNVPMITLVNEGSASASEIVAGALQDQGRSILLGTQTFGKGSVQTIIDLDDGSGLKLTIASYYTPKGRSIQARGITPDIIVPPTPPEKKDSGLLREKDLKGHFENPVGDAAKPKDKPLPKPGLVDLEHDFQLQRALELLKTWDVFRTSVVPKVSGS